MTFGADLRDTMGASAALKEKVLEQIYPLTLPKGATIPAIAYTVITAQPQGDLQGHDKGLWINRVQVDCYGRTYDEAQEIALLVKAALPNSSSIVKCILLNMTDLFEEQRRVPRVSMDFSIHWRESELDS